MSAELDTFLTGQRLYGDDFDVAAIEQWYRDEEEAYYDLAHVIPEYEYHAFNRYYAFDALGQRKFGTCLAFGCADGEDVLPLADAVDRFVAVEPAEKWWRDSIGGKPATFLKPKVSGDIALADATVDIATCLGVIHHIPNVSHVLAEINRVLRPGGVLVLREPVFSMGDWRRKRPGLTSRERGIPPQLLLDTLAKGGFDVQSARPCMVPITPRLARLFGIEFAYNSRPMVVIDRLLSRLTAWNMRYHRTAAWQKIAPTSLFVVATKR